MALSQVIDVTLDFNANKGIAIDTSNYTYAVWQFVNPSGTINIKSTNDPGASSSTQGNATTATNFQTTIAQKLADGTEVTSVSGAGLFKVSVAGRFQYFGGTSAKADKVFVHLHRLG